MATGTPQKWLFGCGIGCAALIVVVVSLIIGAVVYVRGRFQPLQQASDSRKEIVSVYGEPEAYAPVANGTIAPERMEAFLTVRDSLRDAQSRLDTALDGFDFSAMNERRPSFGAVLRMLNDVSNLFTPIGEYVSRRNRILLEKRMGLGEYAYTYSIAYHSWLGHQPDDGPQILAKLRRRDGPGLTTNESGFSPDSIRREYRRVILRLLENQLDAIKNTGEASWRGALKDEIERIKASPERVAWQDNFPSQLEASLKPFRTRLAATYHPATNYFELLTLHEFSQVQWNGRVESDSSRRGGTQELPVEAPETGPAQAGDVIYEVGAGVLAPAPINQPVPAYTDEARKARIEGMVAIQATIRKDGTVGNLKIIRSLGYGLDESAMRTVSTGWKFKSGTLNGVPVEVQARIQIRFRLP